MTEADKREANKNREGFLSGVFALTASAIIVKIIGLVYKIPMLRILGSEGMGYFNCAYEIYALFCIIATSGLPVAMSVMISSAEASGKRWTGKIFRVAFFSFLSLGIVGFAIMALLSGKLSEFIKNEKAFFSVLAISPTLIFVCISSAYRGYFQGHSKMLPTAISQLIEALGKLLLGLLFAAFALRRGYGSEGIAAFAALGLSLGMAMSMLYLLLYKRISDRKARFVEDMNGRKSREIFSELVKIALPVTLSSSVMSLTKLIDMTMILRRLQNIGYSSAEASAVYGSYTTLALPLFSLAPTLISSIALPLVPALSAAVSRKKREEQSSIISTATSLVGILAIPVAIGLCFFSREILELIFAGEREAVELSSPLLSTLGLSVVSACLITVTNAILQAYGKAKVPIISMVVGSILKIVTAYILIGEPDINILGAPISTFFCDMTIVFMNFCAISKCAPEMPRVFKIFVKPFICSVLAVGGTCFAMNFLRDSFDRRIFTLVAIAVSAVLYLFLISVTGTLDQELVAQMPYADKLGRFIYRKNK